MLKPCMGQSAQSAQWEQNITSQVRRSCSWLGRRLQCMWTHIHVVQITIPITFWIAIRNVIRSHVNTANYYSILQYLTNEGTHTRRFGNLCVDFKSHALRYCITFQSSPIQPGMHWSYGMRVYIHFRSISAKLLNTTTKFSLVSCTRTRISFTILNFVRNGDLSGVCMHWKKHQSAHRKIMVKQLKFFPHRMMHLRFNNPRPHVCRMQWKLQKGV